MSKTLNQVVAPNPEQPSAATTAQPLQSSVPARDGQAQPSSHVVSTTPVAVPPLASIVPGLSFGGSDNAVGIHRSTDLSGAAILGTPAPSEPFAALDAEPFAPSTTWILAGPTHAEAGYLDPSLGWVAVRADSAGKTLHATIVPSTPEAAQVLSSHLTEINLYLADHHGTPAQLTVATPESGQSFMGHSALDSSGQQSGQQQPQRDGQPAAAPAGELLSPRSADGSPALRTTGPEIYASGGHISVIA